MKRQEIEDKKMKKIFVIGYLMGKYQQQQISGFSIVDVSFEQWMVSELDLSLARNQFEMRSNTKVPWRLDNVVGQRKKKFGKVEKVTADSIPVDYM